MYYYDTAAMPGTKHLYKFETKGRIWEGEVLPHHELHTKFSDAQAAAEFKIKQQIVALQSRLATISKMTPATCPVGINPYG